MDKRKIEKSKPRKETREDKQKKTFGRIASIGNKNALNASESFAERLYFSTNTRCRGQYSSFVMFFTCEKKMSEITRDHRRQIPCPCA